MADEETQGQPARTRRRRPVKGGPTKRVVLQRADVLVLPDGVDAAKLAEACKVLGIKGKAPDARRAKPVEAWVVVGEFEGDSKEKAIKLHAGEAGTDSALIGTWKAPSASAWAGGVKHTAPPKPLVQKETID